MKSFRFDPEGLLLILISVSTYHLLVLTLRLSFPITSTATPHHDQVWRILCFVRQMEKELQRRTNLMAVVPSERQRRRRRTAGPGTSESGFLKFEKWKQKAFTLFREVQSEIKMLSLSFEKCKVKKNAFTFFREMKSEIKMLRDRDREVKILEFSNS